MSMRRHRREIAAGAAYVVLLAVVAIVAPSFYTAANLRDLVLNNIAVLITAVGMTMVIIVGEIDISVASQFAVCSVAVGLLARSGVPMLLVLPLALSLGAAMGALNGYLIGMLGLPSIIVTLALFVAWGGALRWATEGAWVQNLPNDFQWFGLGQGAGQWLIAITAAAIMVLFAWALRNLPVGREVYAVGADAEAARLSGIAPTRVVLGVFTMMGALVGLAALLNAIRFTSVPSNAGVGLELKAIAAVVVGGTAITGGRGTLIGTLIGTLMLGTIGPALAFVGINPFWEKAVQGGIILAALAADAAIDALERHVAVLGFRRPATGAR
jgi:ribose/xylose/arabinose/galactoside ABC-type transport system permease subunit